MASSLFHKNVWFSSDNVMILFQLDQMHHVLRKIIGGRHIRRPYFDFGLPTCPDFKISRLHLPNGGEPREYVNYFVNRKFIRSLVPDSIPSLFHNIVVNRAIKKSTVIMALNKLSIDKVDLTDKRVLIRYVFPNEKLMKYKKS